MSSQQDPKESSVKTCVTCPSLIPSDQPGWTRQCYDCYKDKGTKRACELCKLKKIPVVEPEWKKVCALCFRDSPMKRCLQCKELNIKSFEWRTLCKGCYDKGDFNRPCQSCKIRPVSPSAPSYVVTCTKCYLAKKRQTHDTCPWCEPDPTRKEALNKRKEAPGCRDCMMSKGLIKTNTTIEVV